MKLLVCFLGFLPAMAAAYLDLADARVERMDNGLTVIILEEHSFPVVSVQMLYTVGARDETTGKTGLAHFLEHMAFRSSENFPDTDLVSRIYDVGGEWHGYTWLDQTTYFATVPASQLGLLLQIEADRMARLDIPASDLESERGAVLTEMHSYENDPATVLQDHVLYLSFLAHPYRNNTIGWESDIANITRADVVDFYQRHYQPGNAVLAIVGDLETDHVMEEVRKYFGQMKGRPASPAPHTIEPVQTGERRIRIKGAQEKKYFKIVYRAPAANNPDFSAFLLIQELLAAGSGVSFLQNDWGTPARPGSALAGISDDLTTWFPPSAQDYVFMISGSLPADGDEHATETKIEAGIDRLRKQFSASEQQSTAASSTAAPGFADLEQARERVLRQLTFDLQTTEDAAHQLAFFEGLDALGVLVDLEDLLTQVSVADIDRVLGRYLGSEKRTIGWSVPFDAGRQATVQRETPVRARDIVRDTSRDRQWNGGKGFSEAGREASAPATLERLSNGTPVIIQRSPLSPTAMLKVVVPAADFDLPARVTLGVPAWGLSSLDFELLPEEIEGAVVEARQVIETAEPIAGAPQANDADPGALLESTFRELLGLQYSPTQPTGPLLLVVSGAIDPQAVLAQLESTFGALPRQEWALPARADPVPPAEIEKQLRIPVAQERLGYIVSVPHGRVADGSVTGPQAQAAWRIVLYILSHGYEGRLGKEAISRQGLVYYIASAYETDGTNDWITLSMGVDPGKLPAMKSLLRKQLDLLITNPPSTAEIEAARNHLLGRHVSAAQSNRELTDALSTQWIFYRELESGGELRRRLENVSRDDVLALLPAFKSGSIVSIRNPSPDP